MKRHSVDFAGGHSTDYEPPIPQKEFFKQCKELLKVSKNKRQTTTEEMPRLSNFSAERIDQRINTELARRRRQEEENTKTVEFEVEDKSWFMVFVLGLQKLKETFANQEELNAFLEQEAKTSSDKQFLKAKKLVFEGETEEGFQLLKKIKRTSYSEQVKLWWCSVAVKGNLFEHEQTETKQIMSCCGSRKTQSENSIATIFDTLSQLNSLESYWVLLEIALRNIKSQTEHPEYYAAKIFSIEKYYGYLAWSHLAFNSKQFQKAIDILKEVTYFYPEMPESYLKLFEHYYYKVKDYEQAQDVAAQAFVRVKDHKYQSYYNLFCIFYSKAYFKLKKFDQANELLLQKFIKHPSYKLCLYHFGRFVVKSNNTQLLGSALGALEEYLKYGSKSAHYWIAKGYFKCRLYSKGIKHLKKALKTADELKQKEIQQTLSNYSKVVTALECTKNQTSKGYKENCEEVKELDKVKGEILFCRMLIKENKQTQAFQKLRELSELTKYRVEVYFELFKLLKNYPYAETNTLIKEMLVKAMHPKVTPSKWVKCVILYSKLISETRPSKAIRTLKYIGKLYPASNLPYVNCIHNASLLVNLDNSGVEALSSGCYSYSCEVCSPEDEEAAPKPDNVLHSGYVIGSLPDLYSFKKVDILQVEHSINSIDSDLVVIYEEKKVEFSVCGDCKFLYLIGKISANYGVKLEDGICAIEDFLKIKPQTSNPKLLVKAKFWRAKILEKLCKVDKAKEILHEITPQLQELDLLYLINESNN